MTGASTLRCVRTTITFDPDVAAELSRRRRHGGPTLRADVNDLIRLGLARERSLELGDASPEPFRTPTFRSGELRFPVDDVASAIAHAEGENHR